MDPILYDTSWTLHRISSLTKSYRNLNSSLESRARQFQTYISSQKVRYEEEEEKSKLGNLRECTFINLEQGNVILLRLNYEKVTYRFILYGDDQDDGGGQEDHTLLLSKASASITRKFISYLTETFHVTVDPLRLPTSILQSTLESYLRSIYHAGISTEDTSNDSLLIISEKDQLLKSTIGNLKITFNFSAPVAPSLKTLDIDIPFETIRQLLQLANEKEDGFLKELAHHIFQKTGIKMPVFKNVDNTESLDKEDAVVRMSRLSCAAYAISIDGRLKFAGKAIDTAVEKEHVVKNANQDLLNRIVTESRRQSQGG